MYMRSVPHISLKDRHQSSEQIEQWACISLIYSIIFNCISNNYTLIESKLIKEYNDGSILQPSKTENVNFLAQYVIPTIKIVYTHSS